MHPLSRAGVAGLALLAVALSGCTNSSTPSAGAPTRSPRPSASTSSPSQPPTASQTSSAAVSPSMSPSMSATPSHSAPATPLCTSAHLEASLSSGGGAAGTTYYRLRLTNTGSATCHTGGYPGVSLVGNHNGTQIGAPADRKQQSVRAVTLAPGRTASATLGVGTAENYPPHRCKPAAADGFRIYPPNETHALFVAHQTMGCRNTAVRLLQIAALRGA